MDSPFNPSSPFAHQVRREQCADSPFNFEAAYIGQLPRLKRTEAHDLLEQLRIEMVHGKNVPFHLVRRPHHSIVDLARDQPA